MNQFRQRSHGNGTRGPQYHENIVDDLAAELVARAKSNSGISEHFFELTTYYQPSLTSNMCLYFQILLDPLGVIKTCIQQFRYKIITLNSFENFLLGNFLLKRQKSAQRSVNMLLILAST